MTQELPNTSAPILLVDDTPANQRVLSRILETLGYKVSVAANGQEAVERVSQDKYAAVLMDLQMPVMDGYQATAAIHELESQTESRTPIIALTANATQEDRQACLAAGMDAYLTKPVDVMELAAVVAAATQEKNSSFASQPKSQPGAEVIDLQATMQRLGGDKELLKEFVAVFHEDAPQLLAELESALKNSNAQVAARAAHSLRGLAANFSAEIVVEPATHLENAALNSNLSEAREFFPPLSHAVSRLSEALAPYG